MLNSIYINPKTNDLSFKYNQPVKYLYESLQPHRNIGNIGILSTPTA